MAQLEKVKSVFDLRPGDQVQHGANQGRVSKWGPRGPQINWYGSHIDYWYTEEMNKVHPLRYISKVPRRHGDYQPGEKEIEE